MQHAFNKDMYFTREDQRTVVSNDIDFRVH